MTMCRFIALTMTVLGSTYLPTGRVNTGRVLQQLSRRIGFQLNFDILDRRSIFHKLPYHMIEIIVHSHDILLGGLSVGETSGVAQSQSYKERGGTPSPDTVVPGFGIPYHIDKGHGGITFVNRIQSVNGWIKTLLSRIMIIIQILQGGKQGACE